MSAVVAERALECLACATITRKASPAEFDECPACGEDATGVAILTPCPSPDDCIDQAHDFGVDMHVAPVEE